MRVLFDFFINIARWAWLRMDFFKAKLFMDKIIDFSVFDKIISQEISVRSPEELTPGRTHQKLSNEPRYRSPFIGDLTRGTF